MHRFLILMAVDNCVNSGKMNRFGIDSINLRVRIRKAFLTR